MTMPFDYSLYVTHGQIAVCDPVVEQPFNNWTDGHFAQGFAWRPGSVSFRTLEEGGRHDVIVYVVSGGLELLPDAVRVIDVPFEVSSEGKLEVASVAESASLDLAAGLYQLRFQQPAQPPDRRPIIRLSLMLCDAPAFEIVRADGDLKPGAELLLTADLG